MRLRHLLSSVRFCRTYKTSLQSFSCELRSATMAAPESTLPLRPIPGDYGIPLYGAVKDRLDYFWFQGEEKFYRSRVEKYKSTVFRVNMPPGPPLAKDSRVICLLDQRSFPTLFDMSKVEKRDVFLGTYMPSTTFTSGYRVCPYLDPSEDRHTKLKQWCFDVIARNGQNFIPAFHKSFEQACAVWENDIAMGKKANVSAEVQQLAFTFLLGAVCHQDPSAPGIPAGLGKNGAPFAGAWALAQVGPIVGNPGLPNPGAVRETVPLPSIQPAEKSKYDAVHAFVTTYGTEALDMAEAMGIERGDAAANLVFFLAFAGYGRFNLFFRDITGFIHQSGHFDLMKQLHEEVAAAVEGTVAQSPSGERPVVSPKALQSMPLLRSVVYEALRYKPPVAVQYAKAKCDFVVESHENTFEVKAGEMLCGFQPLAMRDPKVFERPDEFLPGRFMGPEGEKLLGNLFWSNGRETDKPSVHNKQCAGKDLVVTMAQMYVAELFLRYKDFSLDVEGTGAAAKLFFHTLTKA